MARRRRVLTSEAEFLALPESVDKIELLDGEVQVSSPPTLFHQLVLGRIFVKLSIWAEGREPRPFVGQSPLDVRFGANRILQPDALVVLGEVDATAKGPLSQVPDLCVEVVSTDRVYDRVTKRMIYAAAGVREFWVVELAGMIERWTGPGLQTVEEVTSVLETPLLPGLSIDVEALFGR